MICKICKNDLDLINYQESIYSSNKDGTIYYEICISCWNLMIKHNSKTVIGKIVDGLSRFNLSKEVRHILLKEFQKRKYYKYSFTINNYCKMFKCNKELIITDLKELNIYSKRFCVDCSKFIDISNFIKDSKDLYIQKCNYCESRRDKNLDMNYRNQRKRERREADPNRRFRESLSSIMNAALNGKKNGKSIVDLLSYSIDDLKNHLESQFVNGMDWNNYGKEWHLDHIRPSDSFNILEIGDDEFSKCWSLNNLQPLWKDLNHKKNNQWDGTEDNLSIRLKCINDNR